MGCSSSKDDAQTQTDLQQQQYNNYSIQLPYSVPNYDSFKVRGPDYIDTKIKITNNQDYIFNATKCELYNNKFIFNESDFPNEDKFTFVLNFVFSSPANSFVMFFETDKKSSFSELSKKFFFGKDDEYCNMRLKLIPEIIDGNMVVRMMVKNQSVILGAKLKQTFFRSKNCVGIDIDINSSSVARNAAAVCLNYLKEIKMNLGFCIQGNEPDELPEVMLCAFQLNHLNLHGLISK